MQQQQVLLEQQQVPFLTMQLRLNGGGDGDSCDGTQPEEYDLGGTQEGGDYSLLNDEPPRLLQVEDGEAREWLATELPSESGVVFSVGRTASGLRLHDSERTPGTFLVHGEHATITLEENGYVLRLVGAGMMTYVNEVGYRIINLAHFKYDPGPIVLAQTRTVTPCGLAALLAGLTTTTRSSSSYSTPPPPLSPTALRSRCLHRRPRIRQNPSPLSAPCFRRLRRRQSPPLASASNCPARR